MAPRRVPPLHVRIGRKAAHGLDTRALHHARKACRRERRPPLAGEDEQQLGILLPLQLAQGPQFTPATGWVAGVPFLGPADVQDGAGKIDLIPTQVDKLGRPADRGERRQGSSAVSLCPHRLALAVSISRSTSAPVRCSLSQ